jgi:uncharacterized membrane protein
MKKKSSKSQNQIVNLSQKTYIVIIALLFAYSVYLSTNPVVKVSSDGFDTGFSPLYNLALITILVPIAIFLLFYRLIMSNNKKTQLTSVVFYSVVYTLFTFVVQGVLGHYVFQYTFDQNMVLADWQFFTLLTITYLLSVLLVFGGLALSNPQARLVAKKSTKR